MDKINSYPKIVSNIVKYCIESKKWYFHNHGIFRHYVYDSIVFYLMRKILGGRVRSFISGGAPLSVDVKYFLTTVFSAPIFEAYGMTEAAGFCACTAIWERKGGHVGGILPCLRFQLRDLKDLNGSTDQSPPIGELYVKGNSVMLGYFRNPVMTSKVLDKNGWLKVGDIVTILPNGAIEIIERTEEYKKLQNGQFVAP